MNNSTTSSQPSIAGPPRPNDYESRSMASQNKNSLFQKLENIASLSQVVRAFGACAIIASMSLFMFQGWAEGNDVTRYLKLLAQTGLLTSAGLILSFLIKEFKGARLFFGLALVSVVANFTILGSLTYSLYPIDMQIVDYPASMKWEVANVAVFLPVFLGALVLLSAVTYFGFSIFSRQIAKPLSVGLLALSAILLVPVRDPLIAVGLATVALWGAWFLIQRLRNKENLIITKETKASLALLLLPGIIVLMRAVSFYSIDDATILAFSSLLFVCLRNINGLIEEQGLIKRCIGLSQITLAGLISFLTTQVLPFEWNSFDIFIGAIIFIGIAFEHSLNGNDNWLKNFFTNVSVIALVPALLLYAMVDYELVYSLHALIVSCLAFGLTHTTGNMTGKTPFSRSLAVLGIITAILIVLFDLVQLAQLGNWVIIGFAGAILIICASLYERFGLKLSPK